MSGYRLPAPQGGWIDRRRSLEMRFNDQVIPGFAGDTLASALLAQGTMLVGRSVKLHRPRGIFSCGVEEPSGIVDIGSGALRTPDTRATDIQARNGLVASSSIGWPSLRYDAGAAIQKFSALMPAGFYYKTFMWPHWHLFEPAIRRMAGLGFAGDGPDPERYDEVSQSVEVLVVGAGAAGMHAALAAAQDGRQVLLVESAPQTGGWLAAQCLRDAESVAELAALRSALHAAGVQLRTHTTAVALYDHNLLVAIESVAETPEAQAGSVVRERLWKLRARRIILATGAFERPILFPDNDRPGVMLADAVERYAALYGVACGKRVVIAAACDSAYRVAHSLVAAGMQVAAIVERRSAADIGPGMSAPPGVTVLHDSAIVAVDGSHGVRRVQVAGKAGGARGLQRLEADLVASAGGFTPNVSLFSQAGGELQWFESASMFVPSGVVSGVAVVGACAGVFALQAAMEHAQTVGRNATGAALPELPSAGLGQVPANTQPSAAALAALGRKPGKQFVDLQNDVGVNDIRLAARESYNSVELLKRYTTTGMGTDQGKTSNVNALVVLGEASGRNPGAVGTTRFRPPFKPVTLNALIGGRSGARYRPLKQLPAQSFHMERQALFEEFGGWWRPAVYPQTGEGLHQAAAREARSVRQSVGLFDGSPLGKLEIYGPDAAAFLDLMYVGTMSSLAVGQARYGLLLNENGVIVDDGIVARLADNHFWVNTTSGGAERTQLAFDEWLQCEYVNLQVLVVGQTSQWGNVTVSGPKAWQLLQRVGFADSLAPQAMRHMTLQDSTWQEQTVRVLRASFNGELGYEINLPADRSTAMLEQLWSAGTDLGVCMMGVETLMTLRLEKGFIHIGADTDGTTLPGDVGLARGVEKKKANFVGRRSLMRPAAQDPDRLQLVGLQSVDGHTPIPVGAHLAHQAPPSKAMGHVTSSAFSPVLQQPVALAMLEHGSTRTGEALTAWYLGKPIQTRVVPLPFYDPAGERLNGQ
jgi:sarcosine oxidase subunit alpha